MKRRQMILVLFLAAALAGCGKKDGSSQVGQEIESNAGTEVSMQTESGAGPEADVQTENSIKTEAGAQSENDAQDESDLQTDDSELTEPMQEERGFGDASTMDNNVSGRELPIYCVDTEEKKVALSFDAAWGNEDTAQILEILQKHDIHVTFFMTGGWVLG